MHSNTEDGKPAPPTENKSTTTTTTTTCLQTPHTLRLLKLIREGSPEYARLALERLVLDDIDAHVLWDLLGRLQEILTAAPEWKTRQAAATALEHVARRLGSESGESMWLQQQDNDAVSGSFLTMESFDIDIILQNGRKLYSVAETEYENKDDDAIDQATSVKERLRIQRQLLARRLGLGSICSAVGGSGGDLLPDTITEQDILPRPAKKRKTTTNDGACAADAALLPDSETPFRTLLVETASSAPHTPQTLLATELLVGVVDPVWTIRHGAVLGLLALVRAWKGAWGPWLQDALVRVLSVGTLLDRFGDFGGSDAVVAPVREMAGQLAAVLLQLADPATRDRAFSILEELGHSKKKGKSNNRETEWEMRHGVLAVYKFTVVTAWSDYVNTGPTLALSSLTDAQWRVMCQQSISCLNDESEDVKSAASQVLLEMAQRDVTADLWSCARPLWVELRTASDVASYIQDLVGLFVTLFEKDFEKFLDCAACDSIDVIRLLCTFLSSQFLSIRTASMRSVGLMASVSHFWMGSTSLEQETQQLIICVFDTFLPSVSIQWGKERDATWHKLCGIEGLQTEVSLLVSLTDHYFSQKSAHDALPVHASAAFGQFLEKHGEVGSVMEVALIIMLQSPWPCQCEAACLLYRHVASRLDPASMLRKFVTGDALLERKPRCLEVSDKNCIQGIRGVFRAAFRSILEGVANNVREPGTAINDMLRLWQQSMPTPQDSEVSSVQQMRLSASIAGAQLASNLPAKATPIVQPLMTSLKNETSTLRRSFTCTYTVQFIARSMKTSQHAKAVAKILRSICDAATSSEDSCLGLAATKVLQLLILAVPADEVFHDVPLVSDFLSSIGKSNQTDSSGEQLFHGVKIFLVVSKGLTQESPITPTFVSLVRPLVHLAMDVELQEMATASIITLCKIYPSQVLQEAVPVVTELLSASKTRLSSCRLLKHLVDSAEVSVCPFVRKLLPDVLSIITDKTCGKKAYALFASLVRIAPLVSKKSSAPESKSVIDHLIFGEPLPSYELPQHVESALRHAGIVIRSYQREGIAWLRFLQSVKLSGALCDGKPSLIHPVPLTYLSSFLGTDMGLGKTLQALIGVAIAHDETPGRPTSLVVCPSTLVSHWAAEIEKCFPNGSVFNVLCLVGTRDERSRSWLKRNNQANLVVASYSVLRSDIDHLSSRTWCYCILDEGHLMKNPKTETAKAARRLEAQNKLIMTGTPIQNKVEELFSVFDFLMPNFLGDHRAFVKHFATPIAKGQKEGSGANAIVEGISKLKSLHQMVLPFLLRREKEHVLTELPAKITTVVKVPLGDIQRKIYDRFCSSQMGSQFLLDIHGLGDKIPDGTFKRLLYLRLLCTHPCLVLGSESSFQETKDLETIHSSGKLLALAELLREAGFIDTDIVAADNDQSLLYCSDTVDQTTLVEAETRLDAPDDAVGSLSHRTNSKDTWALQQSKCLVFAQFTKSLDVVEKCVMNMMLPSCNYVRLDGSVPNAGRMKLVNKFNEDPSTRVMLLTTRVGGVGLNLTAADTVIFLEHDFNPHSDLQATDRTRRIGQTKVVKVYKIVAEDTVDEKLLSVQEKKLAVSEAIINTDNSTMFTMGTDRLLDIFSVRPGNHDEKTTGADLDHLTDSFIADYKSLSASFFADSLK